MARIGTCLQFGKDAEETVRFDISLLPDSRIDHILCSPGREKGDVLTISVTLGGQSRQALNGGARADYGTAASISVTCPDHAEVDRLWTALTAAGGAEIRCGWLRNRWGVPRQIVPERLQQLPAAPDPNVASRVFAALQTMIGLDVAALERAAAGRSLPVGSGGARFAKRP